MRIPLAALFIQLRELLIEQGIIKIIDSPESLRDVSLGDIVEFQGLAAANPGYQIRNSISQMMPVIEPYLSLMESQLDLQLAQLPSGKPSKTAVIGGDGKQVGTTASEIKAQQHQLKYMSAIFKTIDTMFNKLFPAQEIDNILFKANGFNAITHVYPALARNERIQDIHDGHWHCIGKVIGMLNESDKYDLLKNAPVNYFAKDQLFTAASLFDNANIKIDITEPVVEGPGIRIATLAIFA